MFYVLNENLQPIKASSLEEFAEFANKPENLLLAYNETDNFIIATKFLGMSPYFETSYIDRYESSTDFKFLNSNLKSALKMHNELVQNGI